MVSLAAGITVAVFSVLAPQTDADVAGVIYRCGLGAPHPLERFYLPVEFTGAVNGPAHTGEDVTLSGVRVIGHVRLLPSLVALGARSVSGSLSRISIVTQDGEQSRTVATSGSIATVRGPVVGGFDLVAAPGDVSAGAAGAAGPMTFTAGPTLAGTLHVVPLIGRPHNLSLTCTRTSAARSSVIATAEVRPTPARPTVPRSTPPTTPRPPPTSSTPTSRQLIPPSSATPPPATSATARTGPASGAVLPPPLPTSRRRTAASPTTPPRSSSGTGRPRPSPVNSPPRSAQAAPPTGPRAPPSGGAHHGIGATELSHFAAALPTPYDGPLRTRRVVVNCLLAVLLAILLAIPSQLFNATLAQHYDDIFARLGPARRAAARLLTALQARVPAARAISLGLFAALAGTASSALDPRFPNGLGSLRLLLAQVLGLVITTYAVCGLTLALGRRYGNSGSIRLRPGGLLAGFALVVLSRTLHISPGFLYGMVVGVQFAAPLSIRQGGRVATTQAGFLLSVAIAGWLGLGILRHSMSLPDVGFVPALAAETLTALSIGIPTSLVLAFIPVTYLRGERAFVWQRRGWLATYACILFVFLSLAANPVFGNLPATTSLTLWLTMYCLFGLGSVLFWAAYRGSEGRSVVDRLRGTAARRF